MLGRDYLRCTLGDDSAFTGSADHGVSNACMCDDVTARMTTMHARATQAGKGEAWEAAAVRASRGSSDGGIHTFSLGDGRKRCFAVLGRGHLGGRGGGSSGLGCGCHTLGW